eukprot:maker-scaffold_2-snap-gene-0.2-mRNA-1 protein AED:0.07 eAED:0.07 QI:116/1/1/1/0.5/0.33/3/297/114
MAPVAKNNRKTTKFSLDLNIPINDQLIDPESLVTYMKERIKVEGKTGDVEGKVAVTMKDGKLYIETKERFPKRYLKFLTKKYLKKQQIRDYLRVIADGKNGYKVKYFNISEEEE